jgi:ribonuclease HI
MLSITGAMRTTATDTLEAHAKLLPLEHCLQNLCFQAAIRIAAHPPTHPLHGPIRRAARRYVKRHRSSLHYLHHATEIDMDIVETITHSRRPPNATPPYATIIAESREQAILNHDSNNDTIKIYCDGSGVNKHIGAAAVLYRRGRPTPRTLRYHLGSEKDHTVYESEAVGLTLAAQLLSMEEDVTYPVSIFVDNQATIKSGDLFSTKPGHYLIDHFRRLTRKLKKDSQDRNFKITVHWISGHDGVEGNERVLIL